MALDSQQLTGPPFYRHFKGGIYKVLTLATLESDRMIVMVVYEAADGTVWTRPANEFAAWVDHEGQRVRRFSLI